MGEQRDRMLRGEPYMWAGALVTRDIPPLSLAVGNPARVIRSFAADA